MKLDGRMEREGKANFQWRNVYNFTWQGFCHFCDRRTYWGSVRRPGANVPMIGCQYCGRC